MTERCQKAYNSLVRAFFEGTLGKYTCIACACGNIIFDAVGTPITKEQFQDEVKRLSFFGYDADQLSVKMEPLIVKAFDLWSSKRGMTSGKYTAFEFFQNEVNAAGYTAVEFARIENAFEDNTSIKAGAYPGFSEGMILEDQYNGLCAVVDVLLELDKEAESPDELKQKFREHPKLAAV